MLDVIWRSYCVVGRILLLQTLPTATVCKWFGYFLIEHLFVGYSRCRCIRGTHFVLVIGFVSRWVTILERGIGTRNYSRVWNFLAALPKSTRTFILTCVYVSIWTRCGSSSTRTFVTCNIPRAFRCTTSHRTRSVSTILTRLIQTRATTRRNLIDSKCCFSFPKFTNLFEYSCILQAASPQKK